MPSQALPPVQVDFKALPLFASSCQEGAATKGLIIWAKVVQHQHGFHLLGHLCFSWTATAQENTDGPRCCFLYSQRPLFPHFRVCHPEHH